MTSQQRDRLIAAIVTLMIAVMLVLTAIFTSLTYPPGESFMPLEARIASNDTITIVPFEELDLPDQLARLGNGDIYDNPTPDPEGGEAQPEQMDMATNDEIDLEPADPAATDTQSTTATDTQSQAQQAKPTTPATKVDPKKAEEERRRRAEQAEQERKRRAEEQKKAEAKQNVDGRDMSNKFQGNKPGNNTKPGTGDGSPGERTGVANGLNLHGRTLLASVNPTVRTISGIVKIRITVDPDGHVIKADPAGGDIDDPAVKQSCIEAAKKLKYSKVDAATGNQTGIISWKFD